MLESISIIIPIYNTSNELISRCIHSCRKQTYRNYKIIVVDDGSTNIETQQTLKSLKDSSQEDIEVFTITNCGASLARKFALENSQSEFVIFLDADDYFEDNALESLLSSQKIEGSDIVIGQFKIFSDSKKISGPTFKLSNEKYGIIRSFLVGDLPSTLWPILYRRETFSDVKFYDFVVGEDLVINSQIFTIDNLKVTVIPNTIYNYYRHDDSLTKGVNNEKTNQGYLAFQKYLEIVDSRVGLSNFGLELAISHLSLLYALIILNSSRCTDVIQKIKKMDPFIISKAITTFPSSKKVMFMILLHFPFTIGFIKRMIKLLKIIKSN